jgi:hypothetical protein
MITTTWKIEALEAKPTEGNYENVVITAHWRCIGTEGDKSSSTYGSCGFQSPSGSFTEYSDLSEEQVLEWCFENIDKNAIEEGVISQVNALINPPVVNMPLPWYKNNS